MPLVKAGRPVRPATQAGVARGGCGAWRAASTDSGTEAGSAAQVGGSPVHDSQSEVRRSLYRSLLRAASVYDDAPALKAFLRRPQRAATDSGAGAGDGEPTVFDAVDGLARIYFGWRAFYRPGPKEAGGVGVSMRQFVRDAFRQDWEGYAGFGDDDDEDGEEEEGEGEAEVGGAVSDDEGDEDDVDDVEEGLLLDAGFAWLAELNTVASIAARLTQQAHEAAAEGGPPVILPFADGLQGTLECTNSLEVGGLLLEHPARSQPGAGVLVVANVDPDADVTALCVNRPLPARAAEVLDETVGGPIGDCIVWSGGPAPNIAIIHSHQQLPGATALCPGLYYGCDIEAANEMLKSGEAMIEDFKLVSGMYQWRMNDDEDLQQLSSDYIECEGAAAAQFALLPPVADVLASGDEATSLTGGMLPGEYHMAFTWQNAMRELGGEFQEFSIVPSSVMHEYERHRVERPFTV